MGKKTILLCFGTIVFCWNMQNVFGIVNGGGCRFIIFEDGVQFTGNETPSDFSRDAWSICKKGFKCEPYDYCPDTIEIFRLNSSEISFTNPTNYRFPNTTIDNLAPEEPIYVDYNPPQKADIVHETTDSNGRKLISYHDGGGDIKTVRINLESNEVEDLSDYINIYQRINKEGESEAAMEINYSPPKPTPLKIDVPPIPPDLYGYHEYKPREFIGIYQTVEVDINTGKAKDMTDYELLRSNVVKGLATTDTISKKVMDEKKRIILVTLAIVMALTTGMLFLGKVRKRNNRKKIICDLKKRE